MSSSEAYISGLVPLPFRGVTILLLHDQRTAIVGAEGGTIAAVDLAAGRVVTVVEAEGSTQGNVGGGEIRYVGGTFLFLARAHVSQCFYTMGHNGDFSTWTYDRGTLRRLSTVPLLSPHRRYLREKIVQGRQGDWSTWTMYSRDVPDDVPEGIVDAKLSSDGGSLLCLTDWFAVFRVDLAGRLRGDATVVADAFAVEPADASASTFWVGRERSGHSCLESRSLSGGPSLKWEANSDIASNGIYRLSERSLLAGNTSFGLPNVTPIKSDIRTWSRVRPLVLERAKRVFIPVGLNVAAYELDTLREVWEPLVGGHDEDVRAVVATDDESHIVSLSAGALRVWNVQANAPVGGHSLSGQILRHDLPDMVTTVHATADGRACMLHPRRTVIVDMSSRSLARCADAVPVQEIGVAAGASGTVHALGINRLPGSPVPGAKGMVSRWLGVEAPPRYQLASYAVSAHGVSASGKCTLALAPADHDLREATAVDVGHGRAAVLAGGHLALVTIEPLTVVAGPVDISRPEGATEWHYYSQAAVSRDGFRLFVRGRGLPIRVYDAMSLRSLGDIPGTEGELGLLLSAEDAPFVLFSVSSTGARSSQRLMLADADARQVVGQLLPSVERDAVLMGDGVTLVMSEGADLISMDLSTGIRSDAPLASLLRWSSFLRCPNGRDVMTLNSDGTCRFVAATSRSFEPHRWSEAASRARASGLSERSTQ